MTADDAAPAQTPEKKPLVPRLAALGDQLRQTVASPAALLPDQPSELTATELEDLRRAVGQAATASRDIASITSAARHDKGAGR